MTTKTERGTLKSFGLNAVGATTTLLCDLWGAAPVEDASLDQEFRTVTVVERHKSGYVVTDAVGRMIWIPASGKVVVVAR